MKKAGCAPCEKFPLFSSPYVLHVSTLSLSLSPLQDAGGIIGRGGENIKRMRKTVSVERALCLCSLYICLCEPDVL